MSSTILEAPSKKIDELEFFAFQTKVRKEILALIRPSLEENKEISVQIKRDRQLMK